VSRIDPRPPKDSVIYEEAEECRCCGGPTWNKGKLCNPCGVITGKT